MKLFRIEWYKDSGGGIEDVISTDILQCLISFYNYWEDTPKNRIVKSIQEIELSETNHIRNVTTIF
jgi:hypothetical protein